MKLNHHWIATHNRASEVVTCALVAAAILALGVATGICKPRPPTPPLPCIGLIHTEHFDQPLGMPSDQVIDPSVWAESWSGYCLDRNSSTVAPWSVPMTGTDRTWVDPASGAIRFWYRPGYDSGTGPGHIATLLTLVSANSGGAVVWWTLAVPQNATNLCLLCQDGGNLVPCLSAPTAFQAGTWALITLCYSETNSALFINDTMVAAGGGLPALPAQVVPYTSLIVGSRGDGLETAAGQIEELACFSGSNQFRRMAGSPFGLNLQWDIADYWTMLSPVAALGPITPEEEAAQAQMRAQRRAARQMAALNTPMGLDGPEADSVPCGTNNIYTVWITNVVSANVQGQGWTVAFTIAGGTNGAIYDVFRTTALNSPITNATWVWLTNGHACDRITLTNQPAGGGFYILGTPLDSDNGGLTDAYERLITHGNINNASDDYLLPPGMAVAIHDSALTRAHGALPTNWNYFVMPESVKEALRSDGTPFVVSSDAAIAGGLLLPDGTPRYPILISLAAEAIGDDEIASLTNYVAAGGFLLVGSSSFTRNAAGGLRSDFALASQMGIHCTPDPTNWLENYTFNKQTDHRLVSHIPYGELTWRMPTSSEEISWGTCPDHDYVGTHQIWAVSADTNVQVLATAGDNSRPYLAVKPYGKGYFIYHAALQPLIGHGGFGPGMYAYVIFRRAVEWAFETERRPVAKLSPWPYQYDAAFLVRHDLENFTNEVADINRSAQYEREHLAKGDYYFCTGTLREDTGTDYDPAVIIAGLRQAVSSNGATIGPHNGGSINPICNTLARGDYQYWHWGPDEALDQTGGSNYAFVSVSSGFNDIDTWLGHQDTRVWVAPYFNATREASYRIQEQLGVKIAGEQKLTPFPHWTLSTQTDGKRYAFLSEPVSDWFVNGYVAQSLEPWHEGVHTPQTMHDGVDFYYELGALINFYSHALSDTILTNPPSTVGYLVRDYISHCTNTGLHPNMWAANATGVYDWWVKRSAAQITASYAMDGDQSVATIIVAGAQDPNTAVEFVVPYSAFVTNLQVFTNTTRATGGYRTNSQAVKVWVGTTVTNVQFRYDLHPAAQNDAYDMLQGAQLTNNVLANDFPGDWPGLTATKINDPAHGFLTLNSDGSFTYTPQTGFYGHDCFTYEAKVGTTPFGQATVSILVAKTNALFNDDFTRCVTPYSLGRWQVPSAVGVSGSSTITSESPSNMILQEASTPGFYGYSYVDAGWTNYSVEARVQFATGAFGGGIGGRLNSSSGEHYAAWIYPDGSGGGPNKLKLVKFFGWNSWGYGTNYSVAMSETNLPSVGTGWHPLKLIFNDTQIQVYYHGTNILTATDSETNHFAYPTGGVTLDMWDTDSGKTMGVDDVIVAPYP